MPDGIKQIETFINTKEENFLFLNFIDEKITNFYEYVFNYYSKKYNFILNTKNNSKLDLFEQNTKISLFIKPKLDEIKNLITNNHKCIVFCDYKNYISYSKKFLSINCYNYKIDVKKFLQLDLDIKNDQLVNGLMETPEYFYSEIEKYNLNLESYLYNITDANEIDFILNIRKNFYSIKNKSQNLKSLFDLLKLEYHYKKFSFLTY